MVQSRLTDKVIAGLRHVLQMWHDDTVMAETMYTRNTGQMNAINKVLDNTFEQHF